MDYNPPQRPTQPDKTVTTADSPSYFLYKFISFLPLLSFNFFLFFVLKSILILKQFFGLHKTKDHRKKKLQKTIFSIQNQGEINRPGHFLCVFVLENKILSRGTK